MPLKYKPIGYRVLAEHVGRRKLASPILLPDKSEIDALDIWVVLELGDPCVLYSGERVPITQVKPGDEILFEVRRSCEATLPEFNNGRQLVLVDVEGILAIVSGEVDPPKPSILIPSRKIAA